MSTSLAPVRLDEHERHRLLAEVPSPSRLDRLEVRLGLWLLLRNARRRAARHDRTLHRAQLSAVENHARREHGAWRHLALETVRV
jgi:hypothetical protein